MSTEPRKVWVTENRCTGLSRVFYTEELCYETLQPNDQIYILIEHSAYQALEQKLSVAIVALAYYQSAWDVGTKAREALAIINANRGEK